MIAMPMYPPGPGLLLKIFPFILGALIFAGLLTFHVAVLIPPPSSGFPQNPELVAYFNTLRALAFASAVLLDAATGFSVAFALFVGLTRPDISERARGGVIIFAAVFLVVWVLFGFNAFSSFRFLP